MPLHAAPPLQRAGSGHCSGLTPEGASEGRELMKAAEFAPAIALGEKGSRNGFKTIFDQRTNMSNVPPKIVFSEIKIIWGLLRTAQNACTNDK